MFTNSDIISVISSLIQDGRTYKNFIRVNKFVYNAVASIHQFNVRRLKNPFRVLYDEHEYLHKDSYFRSMETVVLLSEHISIPSDLFRLIQIIDLKMTFLVL